ncbi:MAG: hypothetical protein KGH94_02725 [Candidatus Micrarchaeota archaeon]|nr:hypothetical protein [Candidatus Micrarchaeota archaeon]
MRSRKELETELRGIKKQISDMQGTDKLAKEMLEGKIRADETSSNLLTILKLVIDENKKNTMILKAVSESVGRLEKEMGDAGSYEQDDQSAFAPVEDRLSRVQPVSGLDAKILQIVQLKNIACADDIKQELGYKGRNAASARLNKLYQQGLLERHQLGHKVYYKYDTRMSDTLIVSPPQ